jgi:hypothetical protein
MSSFDSSCGYDILSVAREKHQGGKMSVLRVIALILSLGAGVASARNKTPDFYKCNNRVGGTWSFGRAPYACDSNVFGEDLFVFQNYNDFVFSDQRNRADEEIAYMSRLHQAVQQVLSWYLLERNPEASAQEQALWEQAIFAKLHQESFWSHYRLTNKNSLKHMRGDFGHGHGISQIDDRWHFVKINEGVGWDLFENLIYGLDVFYKEWVRAANAKCVKTPNSTSRVRAAYSAYNGGPSQLCRWTNPAHRWARNDKNYLDKFKKRGWEKYIQDDYPIKVDPICLAKKNGGCHVDGDQMTFANGDLIKIDNKNVCVFKNDRLECLENSEDLACMSALYPGVTDKAKKVSSEMIAEYSKKFYDRYETCKKAQPALTNIGEYISIKKSINVRRTPGGGKLTVAKKGSTLEVLDFYIDSQLSKSLYYKINYKNKTGYIFAGNIETADAWAVEIKHFEPTDGLLSSKGARIRINIKSGINHRRTIGGKKIRAIPHGTRLTVIDRRIVGSKQKVYYKVKYRGSYGWIYTGAMKPVDHLSKWTQKI